MCFMVAECHSNCDRSGTCLDATVCLTCDDPSMEPLSIGGCDGKSESAMDLKDLFFFFFFFFIIELYSSYNNDLPYK